MGNILYKLIFPHTSQFYIGSTGYEHRYGSINKGNSVLKYRHYHQYNHNVRSLLEDGEFCYWMVVKEYDTLELARDAERLALERHKECEWLLNSDPSTGAKVVLEKGNLFGGRQMVGNETMKKTKTGMFSPKWKEMTQRPRPNRVGEKWWNDGEKNTLSKEQPGPNWERGRLKKTS